MIDATDILGRLAETSNSTAGFWILTSAAAYLRGCGTATDGGPSTVAVFLGDPARPRP